MGQSRWWEQEIPMEGTIQKGELLTYNLTELIKPESYLVRLTPITRYGEGDSTERIITYSGRLPRFLSFNPRTRAGTQTLPRKSFWRNLHAQLFATLLQITEVHVHAQLS